MQDNRKKKKPDRPGPGRDRRELPANVVVGRNAVMELVRSGAPVDKILAAGQEGSIVAIVAEAKKAGKSK